MSPLFSVIIPAKNAADLIQKCIGSVLGQTLDPESVEVIVVVPSFDDNTVAACRSLGELSRVRILVQVGRRIFGAMNTGARAAKGKYLIFLGADDTLDNEQVLSQIQMQVEAENPDVLVGEVELVPVIQFDKMPKKISAKFFFGGNVCHQGMFYRKSLFHEFSYDDSYNLIGDWDLNLRLALRKKNFIITDTKIAKYCTLGISSQPENRKLMRQEKAIMRRKNFNLVLRLLNLTQRAPYRLRQEILEFWDKIC